MEDITFNNYQDLKLVNKISVDLGTNNSFWKRIKECLRFLLKGKMEFDI